MPKPKKSKRNAERVEARSLFEEYIAGELKSKADVGTQSLAWGFYNKQKDLLGKIANATLIQILVKWADDILAKAAATTTDAETQLVLPFSLEGIEVPGAYSFINGANQKRFVAAYKAELYHLDSHTYLMRKFAQEVHESCEAHELLVKRVRPFMVGDIKTLKQAFQVMCAQEPGAA